MKEIDFVRQIADSWSHYATSLGRYSFHWKNNNATLPGLPDLEIVDGKTYYFECKLAYNITRTGNGNFLKHEFTPTQYKFAHLII